MLFVSLIEGLITQCFIIKNKRDNIPKETAAVCKPDRANTKNEAKTAVVRAAYDLIIPFMFLYLNRLIIVLFPSDSFPHE